MTTTKTEGEKVWIACRATRGCKGKYAVLVWRKPAYNHGVPNGETFRYRCTTCNQAFHIHR